MSSPAIRCAVLLAALLLTRSAHAQVIPGALTNASGLTASVHHGVLVRARPMWKESDGTTVALSEETTGVYDPFLNYLGTAQVAPQCWDDSVEPAVLLHPLVTVPVPNELHSWSLAASAHETIAMRVTRDHGTYSLDLYRAGCSAASVALGRVTLPTSDDFTPIAPTSGIAA